MIIRRVGVLSVAKIAAALYALMGLIIGAFISLFALVGSMAAMGGGNDNAVLGIFMGVGAVVALPIFYGVLGGVFAAISAALYNLVAGFVGGIEIEVESTGAQGGGASASGY